MTLPLEGITVVALEQAVAVPFATRQLADYGARVVKIERPGNGDFARGYDSTVHGLSSYFVWLNRSKESLTLDLKRPQAADVMHRLLATADVFIQNLAPGATERLGFGPDELQRRYPRLIICDVSGYGGSGPYRDKKAYDLLIQAETGVVSITGTPETPAKVGISIADIAAGMYAFSGVLLALHRRDRTGEGSYFEVSLFEALGEWMSHAAYYTAYGGTSPVRAGASHATIAPYGPQPTGSGEEILLGLQNEREWERFCAIVLDRPELATDPRFASNPQRVAHREVLDEIIHVVFSGLTLDRVTDRLDRAQIAHSRLRSPQEFWDHPQLAARDRWREIGSPVGPLQAMVPAITMEGIEPHMGPIPAVGEHTVDLLRALGYSREQIEGLQADMTV